MSRAHPAPARAASPLRRVLLVFRAMRPRQWVKNLFVMAPLVFAEQAVDLARVSTALLAFVVFSLLSGAVYLLNDIVDVEGDRHHPTKRRRPIASGALPLQTARAALGAVLVLAMGLAFSLFPVAFAAIGAAYFVLNVGYSFSFKHVPFLDVLTISGGFVMRLVAGAIAISVPLTAWIAVTTFCLAVFLALGKRKHELQQAAGEGGRQRRVLTRYRIEHVSLGMAVFAGLTVAAYAGWTAFGDPTGRLFHPRDLAVTIPFVVFGLFRFHTLTDRAGDGSSPTDRMLSDLPFLINVGLWCLVVAYIIYAH